MYQFGFNWFFIPFFLFGAISACCGFLAAFRRLGVDFDTSNKTVVYWESLCSFVYKRELFPLSGFDRVRLEIVTRYGPENRRCQTNEMSLEGSSATPVWIDDVPDYDEARRLAESLARYAKLDMIDSTRSDEVVRKWNELDESLQQRPNRLQEPVEVPSVPVEFKCNVQKDNSSIVIDFPPQHGPLLICVAIFFLTISVGAPLAIFGPLIFRISWENPVQLFIGGMFLMVLMRQLFRFFTSGSLATFRPSSLLATRHELVYEQRDLTGTRSTSIPADELEELVLPNSKDFVPHIVARSDDLKLEFGHRVTFAELRYLHGILYEMLT